MGKLCGAGAVKGFIQGTKLGKMRVGSGMYQERQKDIEELWRTGVGGEKSWEEGACHVPATQITEMNDPITWKWTGTENGLLTQLCLGTG